MYNDTFKKEIMNLLDECSLKEILLTKEIDFVTLCDWKKEKDASRLIKKYIQNFEYKKALELGEKFPDNHVIQNQILTVLMIQNKNEEIEKIAKNNLENEMIQSQIINILMKKNKYKKALEIGMKFPDHEVIQGQVIKCLIKLKRYDEALLIGQKYPNNEIIQSYIISILLSFERYIDALKISHNFPDNEIIQGQTITALYKLGRYDEALLIGGKYPNNEIIQSQVISVLVQLKRYDAAKKIAKKHLNNTIISRQFRQIKDAEKNDCYIANQIVDYYELNLIRFKISLGTITEKDIELLNKIKNKVDDNVYKLVLAAIYDRLNLKNKAIDILNSINNYDDKKIKELITIVKSKNSKYYNIEKWDNIIGWPIDKEICLEELKEENNFKIDIVKQNEEIKIGEKKDKSKNDNIVSGQIITKNNTHKKNKQKEKMTLEPTIYDSLNIRYKEMVLKLKLQYYREMYDINTRKDATVKYDKLEETLCQKASNQKAFLNLLLMLIGSDFKEIIEYDYNDEFKFLTQKIEKKKQQIKMLTKKG